MTTITQNRRACDLLIWCFAGLMLAILLTSGCSPYATLPADTTATPTTATVTKAAPTMTKKPASPTPPRFQAFIVNVEALEVRTGPTETAANVGYLERGAVVIVYETAPADEYCKTWAKIAPAANRWVCY